MKLSDLEIVKIIWFVPKELNHFSYLYSALIEFTRTKEIILKLSLNRLDLKGRISVMNAVSVDEGIYAKVNFIEVYGSKNEKIKIAFDFFDLPYFFSSKAFEWADIVFKRSYNIDYINKLPLNYQNKVLPMGLPFMVRPDRFEKWNKLKILFVLYNVLDSIKWDQNVIKRIFKSVDKSIYSLKVFENTRTISDFENYSNKLNNKIFYQKRLFESDNEPAVENLNNERINLVKELKDKLPDYFLGGVKKDQYSKNVNAKYYSNISSQQDFLIATRNAGICVYTRGLGYSTGWTLSEFLAQGKCIIGEQLYNELPHSLENSVHGIFVTNIEEIVDQCREMVDNLELMEKLSKNSRAYYEMYVSPKIFMNQLFNNN